MVLKNLIERQFEGKEQMIIGTTQYSDGQVHQGDIFRNIKCIEKADETNGEIIISTITYPYVIILSQECDLREDFEVRSEIQNYDEIIYADKLIEHVLAVPLYNLSHFVEGKHLESLGYSMSTAYIKRTSTAYNNLLQNVVPRYHYFSLPAYAEMVDCVADFKHFFTVSLAYLYSVKDEQSQISIDIPFRERISQRFTNYLSRIGLPIINQ